MALPPKKIDPSAVKKQAFQKYQARRSADAFEGSNPEATAPAWQSFVGERGQRLKTILQSFRLLTNPKYLPGQAASALFAHDVMQRLGSPIPDLPPMRLCEWMNSLQGGRPQGWKEVPPGLAQTAANDGRPALVVGVAPEVTGLFAVVFPDQAASAANPTLIMVTADFALDPGTLLQGFRGQPSRFFANGI
jgi:hypothetical protein